MGAAYWYADRMVLGLVGARELALAEAPVLHSTVERLAALAGVVKPKLYLLPDGFPRAFSAGRGLRGSALAVSTGLLSALPAAELEAAPHTSSPTFALGTSWSRRAWSW